MRLTEGSRVISIERTERETDEENDTAEEEKAPDGGAE